MVDTSRPGPTSSRDLKGQAPATTAPNTRPPEKPDATPSPAEEKLYRERQENDITKAGPLADGENDRTLRITNRGDAVTVTRERWNDITKEWDSTGRLSLGTDDTTAFAPDESNRIVIEAK